MILLQNAVKTFGSMAAVDNIDVQIKKGSIYGLVGPNGAGKSTLLRLISGIYRPDSGMVAVDGEPVYENPVKKQLVFFVPDEPWFIPQSTLDAMAKFYRRLYPRFNVEQYTTLRELFALPPGKRISEFSKGMKRQAAFVLGLAAGPDYLLLDECFDGLDPVKRQVVRKVLCDTVAERDLTVVISSHNLKELDEICDTVGILYKGQMLYSKDLDDLKGEVHKIQVVFNDDVTLDQIRETVSVMSAEERGKFLTLIIKGQLADIRQAFAPWHPAAMEAVPLTLEEVFLYEMEVKGYDATVIFG